MARVHSQKAAKDYPQYGIKKGDTYYSWQLYKQPKRMSKTYPKGSQLTGSGKLSSAREAGETLEENLAAAKTFEDIYTAIDQAIDDINNVAEEYRESAEAISENFPDSPTAQECEEKADELEAWASELGDAKTTIEVLEPDDDATEEEISDAFDEAIQEATANASCPI